MLIIKLRLTKFIKQVIGSFLLLMLGAFVLFTIATAVTGCDFLDDTLHPGKTNFPTDVSLSPRQKITRFWDLELGTLCYVLSDLNKINVSISCLTPKGDGHKVKH